MQKFIQASTREKKKISLLKSGKKYQEKERCADRAAATAASEGGKGAAVDTQMPAHSWIKRFRV